MENTRLLDIIEKQGNSVLKLVLKEILSRITAISGCQSISIRLEKNGDFPFYVHEGLPGFLVLKEDSVLRDSKRDTTVFQNS